MKRYVSLGNVFWATFCTVIVWLVLLIFIPDIYTVKMWYHDAMTAFVLFGLCCLHIEKKPKESFQNRAVTWIRECFGFHTLISKEERIRRFYEEATELAQAVGMPMAHAHKMVRYVYGRPVGDPYQEVGGVTITLAGVCGALQIDQEKAQEEELESAWDRIDKIREKQKLKPVFT